MALVILSWGWIGMTSFLVGFAAMEAIGKVTGKNKFASMELYILMGLLCLTVYAQIFSLFAGVGRMANLLLGVVAMLSFVVLQKKMVRYIVYIHTKIRRGGVCALYSDCVDYASSGLHYGRQYLAL